MDQLNSLSQIAKRLEQIAQSLDKLSGINREMPVILDEVDAYVWDGEKNILNPVHKVSRVPLELIQGVDHVKSILLNNTKAFSKGYAANNALLWGARGMGKSSLIKAIHAKLNQERDNEDPRLILIEISRDDLFSLPALLRFAAKRDERFIIFCDDLSFDKDESSYKALKSALDGGLEGRPDSVLFYATSNRRHLMPRDMIDNEKSTAINPSEAVEEKVSLSDRFGLWLGFHPSDQDTYLSMIYDYAEYFELNVEKDELKRRAIEWAATRGSRSGRVAMQFIRNIAGEKGQSI